MARHSTSASASSILTVLSTIFICFTLGSAQQGPNSIIVNNGFLFHAALTSPHITRIFVAGDIEFTFDSCPFPAAEGLGSTQIARNVTITSLIPISPSRKGQQSKRISAAAPPPAATPPPYQINCNYLTDRFEIAGGYQVTLSNLILKHCRTSSVFGFFRKRAGSAVVLDRVVDDRGAVCVPLDQYQEALVGPAGYDGSAIPSQQELLERLQPYQQGRQVSRLAAAGSNWCNTTSISNRDPITGEPLFPLANNISSPLCKQEAVLLSNVSYDEQVVNFDGTLGHPYNITANNSAVLCPQPVSPDCIRDQGSTACLAAAYAGVNPDNIAPCAVVDGYSLQDCLNNTAYKRVVLVQEAHMNLSTSPATEEPVVIDRDVTIMSDPRGPRLEWDCGLLSNRFQLAPGRTLTFFHMIISNCTTTKPISFIRIPAGSRVVFNDTFVVQPPGLCAPVDAGHNTPDNGNNNTGSIIGIGNPRPDDLPGFQQFQATQAGRWCSRVTGLPENVTFQINSSDTNGWTLTWNKVAVFANETGYGPANAATLPAPAPNAFFVHPTWPGQDLCAKTSGPDPMLMYNYAVNAPYGWQASASAANSTQQQQPQNHTKFGSDLDLVGGSYNGSYILAYFDSVLLCESEQPLPAAAAAANCSVEKGGTACQAKVYAAMNPDRQMVPGAAAYEEAQAAGLLSTAAAGGGDGGSGDDSSNHGIKVVLPAVLASVGGAAIFGAIVAAFVARRRQHNREAAVAQSGKDLDLPITSMQQPLGTSGGPLAWLGLARYDSSASSDVAKRLLGIHSTPSARTSSGDRTLFGVGNRDRASARSHQMGPDGIQLGTLLGAGSFGRVYAGTWQGQPVAVKVITHSRADDTRISQELTLSISFDHPNLVRALHYVKVDINPRSPELSEGDSDIFLPSGAVGVFTLPTDWAVVQRTQQAAARGAPAIDTETWIVMDLMDHGNLAASLRHGNLFLDEHTGGVNMARLLRRASDVASGLVYLHSRSVCHGDLKWENVLLKTEGQDPDGIMAKIADFGLSRALAFGQSHLSTRRYGTVTHMPPELLVAGKLTPSADVYSFGVMMWELVSRSLPFEGLHHGEVIHRVVTEDLRPGPWPTPEQTGIVLPADYIPLTEACWARKATDRPTMADVLGRLLDMLAEVEGTQEV